MLRAGVGRRDSALMLKADVYNYVLSWVNSYLTEQTTFSKDRTTMKYLVTGGAGFIGSHIVAALMSDSTNHVTVLDNLFTGTRENIAQFLGDTQRFRFIEGDVCNPIDIPVDRIYHLACPASPRHYQDDPLGTISTCFCGTQNMLDLAAKYKARMVFTSTSEVYGDPEVHPQPETYWGSVNCRGPRSCYDEGKRAAETLCFCYVAKGVDVRTARLFNTYGPNMHPLDGRVISNFIMQALEGKDITIYGNGSQTRSFGYVDDTVRGLLSLMEVEPGSLGGGEVSDPVNIGNPGEFTIKELAEKVKEMVGSESNIVYADPAVDDPKQRKPDITRAHRALKWKPAVSLDEGLAKTIPYFRKIVESKRMMEYPR